MEDFKERFIQFLLRTGALRVEGDFSLKSKRLSPWFVNIGDFNDGESSAALGEFYAASILGSGVNFDLLYGIPEKGSALAVATAIEMARKDKNVPWFFTRKVPKEYGEATNLSQADRIKALVVGRAPKDGQAIIQLDDVFTAGDAKYEARAVLQGLGKFELPLLAIAVDRMEVGIDGQSAIEEYEKKTGTRVVSVVNALDIIDYYNGHLKTGGCIRVRSGKVVMEESQLKEVIRRMSNYLRVYGTSAARNAFGGLEQTIIERDRSVIPACDVETLEQFEELVRQTADVEGIGAYKVGFELGLGSQKYSLQPLRNLLAELNEHATEIQSPAIVEVTRKITQLVNELPVELLLGGLERVVQIARKYTTKPIIYDHQKAGTDIPDTGKNFARTVKKAGVDAIILFPQAGPETERAWIYHAFDHGLKVIVGGRMTHPAYAVSEGGFITDEGAMEMYRIAARAGVRNFVVPGNKPAVIKEVREAIEAEGVKDPVFCAPGFIAQGGVISDAAKVGGDRFHGIVGRGIYQAKDMRAAAIEHTSQLTAV